MDVAVSQDERYGSGRAGRAGLAPQWQVLSLRDDDPAGDGDTKVGLAGARTIYAVNTIAQGMSVDPAKPVVTAACFFVAGGSWVRSSPGIPSALLLLLGGLGAKLGHFVPRER
jgi:hypothetical protein